MGNIITHLSSNSRTKTPTCPAHLTGAARDEWRRVAAVMAERGDLGAESLGTLEQYCVHYGRWREAETYVTEHGPVVPAPKTEVLMHSPWLTVANRASDACLKLAKSLRITPDTRPDGGKAAADQDPWDGLL